MLDATTGATLQFILDVFSDFLLHDSGFPYEQCVYFCLFVSEVGL
jgi:hypothetical protein